RMWRTLSTSTANWITDMQSRSVCTITLAMLRWTNTSPGDRSMTWLAGTRESEQPIHRYLGARSLDRRSQNPGSSSSMRSAQDRLLRSNAANSFFMRGCPCVSMRQGDADVARFGEEAHRLVAAFATQAGLAGAAERGAQVAHQPGVDPDHAHLQLCAEAVGAVEVAGPDRGGQTVVAGIGQRQRLGVVFEGLQRGDRAEDFLAVAGAIGAEAFDHGRCHVPARTLQGLAAAQHLSAFIAGPRDGGDDLVEMRLRHQRAEIGVRVHRVAGAQRKGALDEGVAEFGVDAALDQDARAAQADLPGVLEGRAHDGRQLVAPVAVGEHDRGILAAEFQR